MAKEDFEREREEDSLDLNNTDFFIWNYGKLCDYQRKLISVIASLESQLDRQTMRLENWDLLQDYKDSVKVRDFHEVFDERWRKAIVFNLGRARLLLQEVTRRMGAIEVETGIHQPVLAA